MAVIKLLLIVATISAAILLGAAALSWTDGLRALEEKSKRSLLSYKDVSEVWESIMQSGEDAMWKYERAREVKKFLDSHGLKHEAARFTSKVVNKMVEIGEIDSQRCKSDKFSNLDGWKNIFSRKSQEAHYVDFHKRRFKSLCAVLKKVQDMNVNGISLQHKRNLEELFDTFTINYDLKCKGPCDFSEHEVELVSFLERFLRQKWLNRVKDSLDNLYQEYVIGPCTSWLIATADLRTADGRKQIGQTMGAELYRIVNAGEMCHFINRHEREILNKLRTNMVNKPPSSLVENTPDEGVVSVNNLEEFLASKYNPNNKFDLNAHREALERHGVRIRQSGPFLYKSM